MLHYMVAIQACLYKDVDQWLNQLLENDHTAKDSVHKFKSIQEQVSTQSQLILASVSSMADVV